MKIDRNVIWLLLLGILLFIPFNGSVHLFDWDEINFAESAREMIVSGNYLDVQINYEVFWEKPPLFFWMQVISMKVFGINEFAARFPNAIAGVITLIVLYLIGKKLHNKQSGLVWAGVYTASLLPFFYFKSGIIDPWFNLFIFLGIWFMVLYTKEKDSSNSIRAMLSAFFIGLGILTKGPVALLIFIIVVGVFFIVKRFRVSVKWYDVFLFLILLVLTGGFWFFLQIANGHTDMVVDFLEYQIRLFNTQDAGHGGFPLYHVVILFFGVFPASIFAIREFISRDKDSNDLKHMHLWMIILFFTVLILFSIVKTKIVHYSSLCYFPLTYLAALRVQRLLNRKDKIKVFEKILLGIMLGLFSVLVLFFSQLRHFIPRLVESELISDPFAKANLMAPIQWTGMEFIPALILILTIIFVFIILRKKQVDKAILILAVGMISFQFSTMRLLLPRIEEISQKTAISFYQSLPQNECYVETLGFKSYAHLFYFSKPMPSTDAKIDKQWLLWGDIDKPAYFVSKITGKEEVLENHPTLEIIGEENGFVFYLRSIE